MFSLFFIQSPWEPPSGIIAYMSQNGWTLIHPLAYQFRFNVNMPVGVDDAD